MSTDLLSFDDLPPDARQLLDAAEQEETTLRATAESRIDEIRNRADRAIVEIQGRLEEEVRARQTRLFRELRPLQDKYAKEGKLDEALAIRERLRGLRGSLLQAVQDPGSLVGYSNPPGSSLLFDVTGSNDGIVWGTDVYTGDSTLATVAVHAGVLNPGERALVRITFVDTLNVAFIGSERHGVSSQSYGAWPVGYRIERG